MSLPCLVAPKVFQVNLCHLHLTMAHLTRKFEHLTTTIQVHLGKRVTKHVSRHLHPLHATPTLNTLDDFMNTLPVQWPSTSDKQPRLTCIGGLTILMKVLPQQPPHPPRKTYFSPPSTLSEHPDIGIMHLSHLQSSHLRDKHNPIPQQQ